MDIMDHGMAELNQLAQQLVGALSQRGLKITTAESCTGGLIAGAITSISGSSAVFDTGFVTYANGAKIALLGVQEKTLANVGAVSEQTAKEMAEGTREKANADVAISATGIAGPTGGNPEKPVGLVFIGIATEQKTEVRKFNFKGNREEIRTQSVRAALELALEELKTL
jgi:PncC family amidohydrolase